MSRAVGIRQVAEHAGVSIGTVSNAINRPEMVSAKMLALVQATMDELGFVRNDLARQVRMGGGTTLGMIVLNVENPFFAALSNACEAAAEQNGFSVVLGSSSQVPEREDRYLDLFEGQRVEGLLVAPVDGVTDRMRKLHRHGMPFVLFDPDAAVPGFCTVAMDGEAGARLAVSHLLESGRNRLAFVGGPLHQVRDRWRGAVEEVGRHPGSTIRRIDTIDQNVQDGLAVGEAILREPPERRPDGIFAATDLIAIGIMQALLSAPGVRVPEDVALIGYDDISQASTAIVPLTTIRQPTAELARAALSLVLTEREEGVDHEHQHALLAPALVRRRSA
ncbi:LacI family DNA-binding transcriptional regulator [Microbacterium sp.]|uniref:LacI family DNA-binding transcriptional regulator n=1 Tax=Microbacterium sp. TaxID=51671 RepID=UPI00333E46F6